MKKTFSTCTLREDLIRDKMAIWLGDGWFWYEKPLPYKWVNDDTFCVFHNGQWIETDSIDFEFID
jgi:hypothetical protein